MSRAAALYNADVLALATSLAALPLSDDLALRGSARAPICGSTLELGLALDNRGAVTRVGLKVHACAIGQAAAALFAHAAPGRDRAAISSVLVAMQEWLADPHAALPDWPGLASIEAARAYPARHGAILLPWKAALAALP